MGKHYQKTSGDTKTSLRLPENSEFLRRFLEENNVDTGGRRVEASIYNHNIVLMKDQSGKPTQKFHHDFTGTGSKGLWGHILVYLETRATKDPERAGTVFTQLVTRE